GPPPRLLVMMCAQCVRAQSIPLIAAARSPLPSESKYFFFMMHTSPTKTSTLSLHDALPISSEGGHADDRVEAPFGSATWGRPHGDRKSTRLNSSHRTISYAVFCLKKKKKNNNFITESLNKNVLNNVIHVTLYVIPMNN